VPIVGWPIPEPRYDPQAFEPQLTYCPGKLSHSLHGSFKIHGRETDESTRVVADEFRDCVIREDPFPWTMPGGEDGCLDPGRVHELDHPCRTDVLIEHGAGT